MLNFANNEYNPLGYNNDALRKVSFIPYLTHIQAFNRKEFDPFYININLSTNQMTQDQIRKIMDPITPAGLPLITFVQNASATEKAMLIAMFVRGKGQW